MTKSTIQITLLGDMAVVVDGEQLPLGAWTSKGARLLFFVVTDRSPIHRDEIRELLWPDFSPSRLSNIFHATRWRMNNALGQSNLYRRDSVTGLYSFDDTRVEIEYDVARFEQAVDAARSLSEGQKALEAWRAALRLYSGPYLPDVYEEWALKRRRQLSGLHIEALTTAAELSIEMNDVEGAIRLYRRVLDEDEHAGGAYYQLLLLLMSRIQLGAPNDSLRQFRGALASAPNIGIPETIALL